MSEHETDFLGLEQRLSLPTTKIYFVDMIQDADVARDKENDLYCALRELGIEWFMPPYRTDAEVIRVPEHLVAPAQEAIADCGYWIFLQVGPDGASLPESENS